MTLYLQEELFSLDHFDIWDEDGNVKYQVERELFQFGRKLVVADMQGREVCFVQHIPFSIPCAYELAVPGGSVRLDRQFSFFTQQYSIDQLGWEVSGSFWTFPSYRREEPWQRLKRRFLRFTTATGWKLKTPRTS